MSLIRDRAKLCRNSPDLRIPDIQDTFLHVVGNHSMHAVYWKIPFPFCSLAWKQAHSPTDVTSQKAWEKQHIQVAFVALFLPNTESWTKAVELSQRAKRRQSHSEAEWITEGTRSEQVWSHNEGVNSKWGKWKLHIIMYRVIYTKNNIWICTISCVWYLHPTCSLLGTIHPYMCLTCMCSNFITAHRHKHTYSVPSRDFYSRQ